MDTNSIHRVGHENFRNGKKEKLTNIIFDWKKDRHFLPLQEATLDHLILSVITQVLVKGE